LALKGRGISCPHPNPLPEGEGVITAFTRTLALKERGENALTPALSQREREVHRRATPSRRCGEEK